MLNDVFLCLLLQLTECIEYSLSKKVIKLLVNWQSILHLSGWLPDRILKLFSEWCIRSVLVWNEDDDILTDIAQYILGVVVTGIE